MQKLFCLLLCLGLGRPAFSQQGRAWALDAQTQRITFEGTCLVAGASQSELAARTRSWAGARRPATKPLVVAAAPETGVAVLTGTEEMLYPTPTQLVRVPLHYTLTLTLEAGSYHYRATDFVVETAGSPAPVYVPAETFLAQVPAAAGPNYPYLVRTAFEEATAQLLGSLQAQLTPAPTQPLQAD
ncbi:DUF4468 domain-containing protein [Hymenobacter sp. RP-2-7]|uniref:DUF4468 domain-containing protein n=1 Tax=Hymenobacter polaris TaxID=2682546 RepID=A0A7Y0AFA2_9BACT|nr:DUF4468 domain-containing protein [Hymenobacter polaris]NML66295.1 DUF4468 domain-containing protein [Hymenobacter polaris]